MLLVFLVIFGIFSSGRRFSAGLFFGAGYFLRLPLVAFALLPLMAFAALALFFVCSAMGMRVGGEVRGARPRSARLDVVFPLRLAPAPAGAWQGGPDSRAWQYVLLV